MAGNPDAAAIARRLSKAQRAALMWLPADGGRYIKHPDAPRRQTMGVLWRHALTFTTQPWCRGLTERGLAVRQAIEAEGGRDANPS